MDERVLEKTFLWPVIIILVAVLGIAVTPGLAAEPSYNLQQLFDGQPIPVGNLIFDNFTPGTNTLHDASDYEKISVEIVGAGTLNPGLKFVPDPDSSPPIWSAKTPGTKKLSFSYEVNAASGYSITGSSLILDPGNLESSTANASATVRDGRLEVKRELYVLFLDGPQAVAERLEAISTFSGQAIVHPNIEVMLYFKNEGDQASIEAFEQRFSLAPAPGGPIADAGDDQVVFDQVTLKPTISPIGGECLWELYLKKDEDNLVPVGEPKECEQATFSDLENGFYLAKLTVTNEKVSAVDFVNIYAAGPCDEGPDPKTQEYAELNLWDFTLKKYKYCKWSTARVIGTFDLPDDFEFNRGDDMVGKVTIQLNRGDKPLVVMSDDIKLKVRNWKYKMEISRH